MNIFKQKIINSFQESEDLEILGFRPNPKSVASMTPGDILAFNYEGSSRIVLIISTKRGRGVFLSSRMNLLVSVVDLDLSRPSTFMFIKALHKNIKGSNYLKLRRSIFSVLGKENFRTFDLQKMRDINEVAVRIHG